MPLALNISKITSFSLVKGLHFDRYGHINAVARSDDGFTWGWQLFQKDHQCLLINIFQVVQYQQHSVFRQCASNDHLAVFSYGSTSNGLQVEYFGKSSVKAIQI